MRVIVTGGCGYIGAHTAVELLQAGWEVVIADNLSHSEKEVLDEIRHIAGIDPEFHLVDLADPIASDAFFAHNGKADALIHFAAFLSVEESVREPLKYYQNNLFSLINVLRGMQAQHIPHLVFSSSCTVYGQPDVLPIREDAPFKAPASPYGHTKQIAEEILQKMAGMQGISAISLRYFNPIGAHPSARIGELPYGIPHHLVPYITQTAAGERPFLRIFGGDYDTPDGTAVRDYIHVVDLAQAHLKAMERLQSPECKALEIYNIGVGRGYSVLEMVRAFEEASGIRIPCKIVGRREGDVQKVWADTSLANEVLQWKAEKDLIEMMDTAWKWEQHLRETGWYDKK
jgi:UDP-glucose 4-epimerase